MGAKASKELGHNLLCNGSMVAAGSELALDKVYGILILELLGVWISGQDDEHDHFNRSGLMSCCGFWLRLISGLNNEGFAMD